MNEYIGKICPYCKCELTENDDIVVCSVCDMPHHKECWIENQSCTTFGCLGSIKNADGSPSSVTATELSYEDNATVYCSHCGFACSAGDAFCGNCGGTLTAPVAPAYTQQTVPQTPVTPVYTQQTVPQTPPVAPAYAQQTVPQTPPVTPVYTQQTVPQTPVTPAYAQQTVPQTPPVAPAYNQAAAPFASNVDDYAMRMGVDKDVVLLIGTEKRDHYIPKFQQLKQKQQKNMWNWSAFLMSGYWFLYRKMYVYGAAAIGASVLFSFIPGLWFLSLFVSVAAGLFGDYLYMTDVEKKAAAMKQIPDFGKAQYVSQNGGTNTMWPIIAGVVLMVISIIRSIIMYA